jgi:hypothetical protein
MRCNAVRKPYSSFNNVWLGFIRVLRTANSEKNEDDSYKFSRDFFGIRKFKK